MIVLDSNQLRQVLPGSPALKLFTAAPQQTGHTLATTDVVIREVSRQRRESLASAISGLKKAQSSFNKLVSPGHKATGRPFSAITPSFARQENEAFESAMRETFFVLQTDPEDALEALLREAAHAPPCVNGEGGRDASIWLTAVRASRTAETDAAGSTLPTIFVSQDKGFSQPGDAAALSPALAADISDPASVLLCPTVVAAMSAIGFPTDWVDATELTASSYFHKALLTAVANAGGPILLLEHMDTKELTPPKLIKGGRAQECCGEGLTMTSVSGEWRFRVITGQVSATLAERHPSAYKGYAVRVEGTALIVQNTAGDITEAEFSLTMLSTSGA